MTAPLEDDRYEGRIEKETIARIPIIPGFSEYESARQYLKDQPRINQPRFTAFLDSGGSVAKPWGAESLKQLKDTLGGK